MERVHLFFGMKFIIYILAFLLLSTMANASKPLVSSFMTHLATSLSFLPDEDVEGEFDVWTRSVVYI